MYGGIRRFATVAFILFIAAINYFMFFGSNLEGAAIITASASSYGISVNPEGPLFKLTNMAPGERFDTVITVTSNFDKENPVLLSSEIENGSQLLFNTLIVSVECQDQSETIYSGSFRDLHNVNLGTTVKDTERKYVISVLFPAESGNEFQGLSMSAKLIFSSEADEQVNSPETGDYGMQALMIPAGISSALLVVLSLLKQKKVSAFIDGIRRKIKRAP